jgi:hypothetical protein
MRVRRGDEGEGRRCSWGMREGVKRRVWSWMMVKSRGEGVERDTIGMNE